MRLGVLAWACAVVGLLAVNVGSASAALQFPFDGSLAPSSGSFGSVVANSVAVNDFNGNAYVADSSSGTVDVFNSAGSQIATWDGSVANNPPGTPAGSFGGGEVFVAADNTTGDVFVLDPTDNVVDEFSSSGSYVCQITGSATPSATECNGASGSQTPAGGFSSPTGIAVDQATGAVYVLDPGNGVIDIFSSAGAYQSQVALSQVPTGFTGFTSGIAVSALSGHVYVSDSGSLEVYEFDGSGNYVTTWTGSSTPAGSFGGDYLSVAADDASGRVYVSEDSDEVTDVFDASGDFLGQFSHAYSQPRGTAVDQASGKVYVSDNGAGVVDVFGPAQIVPDVSTGSASSIAPMSATLNGTVNPDGIAVSDCHFDYVDDADYNASAQNPYSAGNTVACSPSAGSGSSSVSVSADVTGLSVGTTYHFRLEATNSNGTNYGSDVTLQTPPPPSIDSAAATNLTATSADLNAQINPNGLDTTYHFQYGTSSGYGTTVPVPDGDIGSGTSDVAVGTQLTGLTQDTEYHWRVVATNAAGISTGVDHTFIYDTTGPGLPDGRGYEMVTPVSKNGANVGVTFAGGEPQVSSDGNTVMATSDVCFGDVGSCTGSRQTQGEPYEFTRTSSGWVSTPLAPPTTSIPANTQVQFFADDGTAAFAWATPPAGEDDFWARRADGSFADIGPVYPPADGAQGSFAWIQGTHEVTPDLSHLVYEVRTGSLWPFDATTGDQTLYEYSGTCGSASACASAHPSLVGVTGGAGSTDLISVCGTELGNGGGFQDGAVSEDGATVFFTVQGGAGCVGSGANSGVAVPAYALYARIDGSRTVPISTHSPGDCGASCQSSAPANATFQAASFDGSTVAFTSTQQLTDEATDGSENLYLYDFNLPAGHNLVDVSAGDTSGLGPEVQGRWLCRRTGRTRTSSPRAY